MAKKSKTSTGDSNKGQHYLALPVGTKLFEFEIEAVLGHGGFGITYLAKDTMLQESVAIKEYLPNDIAVRISDATIKAKTTGQQGDFEAGLKSFLEEARMVARFRHLNIVHIRRFFELHGTGYIVLDYESGEPMSQRLQGGPLSEAELEKILSGILDGLEALHERATLHRDLKPSNVILREDGTPVLIDFGAARDFQIRHSLSVTAIASPGYSPPEQYGVGGQQGPWTDLYALGAIAYRCVTGNAPPDSLRRLRNDPIVPATDPANSNGVKYDQKLLQTIDWMLRIDERERPASVEAVRAALLNGPPTDIKSGVSIPAAKFSKGADGSTLLELGTGVDTEIVDLAFCTKDTGKYLAPSLDGKANWRTQPHYFSLFRADERPSGQAAYRIGPEISDHLPQGPLTITSADGFINVSAAWSAKPAAAARVGNMFSSLKRGQIAAAIAILLGVVAVAGGVYFFQKMQMQAKLPQLRQEFAAAHFDKAAIEKFLQSCGLFCPDELKSDGQNRLSLIATEETNYRAANDSSQKLRAYLRECRACNFRDEATARATELEAVATRKQLEIDRQRAQQERAERIESEARTYNAARNNQAALEQYVRDCRICTFRAAARDEIDRLIEAKKRWNAVAGGIWRVNGIVQVAIGYSGTRRTEAEARASAQEQCEQAGGQNCKVIGASNSGCYYITTGRNNGGAGWNAGASSDIALRNCRAEGYVCKTPIGGCVE